MYYLLLKNKYENDLSIKVSDQIESLIQDYDPFIDLIKNIISIVKEDYKKKIKKQWEEILILSGLSFTNDSLESSNIKIKKESDILKFAHIMDKKIGKRDVEESDVEEILKFNSDLKGEIWFHKWYQELGRNLDNLINIINENIKIL